MLTIIRTFFAPYMFYLKLGAIVFVLCALGALYWSWKSTVERTAILEFKLIQQESILKSKEAELKILESQIQIRNNIIEERDKSINEAQKKLDILEQEVHTNNTDHEADKIFKDAIDSLKKTR